MNFRPYEKIHRLGKDEVDGILDGEVLVQEKIDGANTSIWMENDKPHFASRNQEIISGFNGFVDYINAGTEIRKLLYDYSSLRLYGEWLVPHTVQYNKDCYKHWYMYDIFDTNKEAYLHPEYTFALASEYLILTPRQFGKFINPTEEQLKEFVGQSALASKGEGIVIKNHNFINRWGNRVYAKMVRQEFLEDNAIAFNSNSKASEAYNEMYIINKWMTKARVDKIMAKLQPEINERLDMKHIPRIINTAYYDMITEEAWEIAKMDKQIDYKKLKGLAMKKAKLLFVEILNVRT